MTRKNLLQFAGVGFLVVIVATITQFLGKLLGHEQVGAASEVKSPNTVSLEIVDAYIVSDPTQIEDFWENLLKTSEKQREELSKLSPMDRSLPFVDIKVRNLSTQPIFLKEVRSISIPTQEIDELTRESNNRLIAMLPVMMAFIPTSSYHILLGDKQDNSIKISQLVKPNDVDRFLLIINSEFPPKYAEYNLKLSLLYNKDSCIDMGSFQVETPSMLSIPEELVQAINLD